MPGCCRAWWDSVSSGTFHYSCPPSSLQFPFFLLSIPSSALLLSQRAMDLLEGITKKAWRYRAFILMDVMQEGEGERLRVGEEKWGDEYAERRRRDRQGRNKHKQHSWEDRKEEKQNVFLKIHFLYVLCLQREMHLCFDDSAWLHSSCGFYSHECWSVFSWLFSLQCTCPAFSLFPLAFNSVIKHSMHLSLFVWVSYCSDKVNRPDL